MSLLDMFRRKSAVAVPPIQANRLTTSEDLAKVLETMLNGGATKAGVAVGPSNAETLTAVYRCVRYLSDKLAWQPVAIYRRKADGNRERLDHPVTSLLTIQPNDRTDAMQFRRTMQRDLELRGNAFAIKTRGVGGRVLELTRVHPDRVSVSDQSGEIRYRIQRTDHGTPAEYGREDVFHLWEWSDDGVVGKSTIQAHRETIGEGLAMRTQAAKMFANGVRTSGILQPTDPGTSLGPKEVADLRADFEETYGGTENAFSTVVLPGGLEYKQVSLSMKDAQFIETRKLNLEDVARIFGLPPHKIGALDRATFNNIEHLSIEEVTDAIKPRAMTWSRAIHCQLLDADPTLEVEYDLSYLLQGDFKSRQEGFQIQRRNGVISANEWREEEGWNRRTDPGGDQYIVESNMALNDGRDPAAKGSGAESGAGDPASDTPPPQSEQGI